MLNPHRASDRSYFEEEGWRHLTQQAASDLWCPRWLVAALDPLGRLAALLPVAQAAMDESRFDMIYPH
jgi:hypothetical protein